jgi:cytochrome P450
VLEQSFTERFVSLTFLLDVPHTTSYTMGGLLLPALAASVVLGTVYTVVRVVYNLYFHPLAKFPGPKLNAITPIPAIFSLLRGRIPLETKQMHDKYGPVVRVSPTELSFNGAQAWEDIYGHRQGLTNMHKDPIHVGSVDPIPGVTTLTMADDANHSRQRRALAYPFSQKALIEQEHIVQGYVDMFIEKLGLKADRNEAVNLVDYLNYTTFDIIGDLAFGEPFGCLKDEKFHDVRTPQLYLLFYTNSSSGSLSFLKQSKLVHWNKPHGDS